MEIAKNITKNALTFFAVGVLLAVAAPYLASGIGLGEAAVAAITASHAPLWTGVFFGGFGALHAAVAPVLDYVFSGKQEPHAPVHQASVEKSPSPTLNVDMPQPSVAQKSEKKFQEMIAAQNTQAQFASR